MKKVIETHFGFVDGEVLSLFLSERDKLIVHVKLWNDHTAKVTFFNVLSFSYSRGTDIEEIYDIDSSPYLDSVLSDHDIKPPFNRPFKLFQIDDKDDNPLVRVVAVRINIEYFDYEGKPLIPITPP